MQKNLFGNQMVTNYYIANQIRRNPLKGKYGRFLQLSSMPTGLRLESVHFELPKSESKKYLASTLFWMELNCMHISSSNRCYKIVTIVAGRWYPLFVVIWLEKKLSLIYMQINVRVVEACNSLEDSLIKFKKNNNNNN